MPGPDPDLVRPLQRRLEPRLAAIHLRTKVTGVEARADGLLVALEGPKAAARELFDRVLVAVGRKPNGDRIGAEAAGLRVDERRLRRGGRAHGDESPARLRDRRRRACAAARAQGEPRGQVRRGGRLRSARRLRRPRDPVGRVHRPRGGVGRCHRERGARAAARGGRCAFPVGRERARARHGPQRGHHQAALCEGHETARRRRHRRPARRRPDLGVRARDRDSAPTPTTSHSPCIRTRRSARPSASPRRSPPERSRICTCPAAPGDRMRPVRAGGA